MKAIVVIKRTTRSQRVEAGDRDTIVDSGCPTGKLGITIQDPHTVRNADTFLAVFLFVLRTLARVDKLATSLLALCYYEHLC